MAEETNENEKKVRIEGICKRIEDLSLADYLSEDQKLSFVREALKIISKEKKYGDQ
jgi:hypothetical protein